MRDLDPTEHCANSTPDTVYCENEAKPVCSGCKMIVVSPLPFLCPKSPLPYITKQVGRLPEKTLADSQKVLQVSIEHGKLASCVGACA
jgi:hypothetical protein